MEVITWNRALNASDIQTVMGYLDQKTINYVSSLGTKYPWWHCYWSSMQSTPNPYTVTFDNSTYVPVLSIGAGYFTLTSVTNNVEVIQVKVCGNMTPGFNGNGACTYSGTGSAPFLVRGIAIGGTWLRGNTLVIYANTGDGGVLWNNANQQANSSFSNPWVTVTYNDATTGSWLLANFANMTVRLWLQGPAYGGYYLTGEVWQRQTLLGNSGFYHGNGMGE